MVDFRYVGLLELRWCRAEALGDAPQGVFTANHSRSCIVRHLGQELRFRHLGNPGHVAAVLIREDGDVVVRGAPLQRWPRSGFCPPGREGCCRATRGKDRRWGAVDPWPYRSDARSGTRRFSVGLDSGRVRLVTISFSPHALRYWADNRSMKSFASGRAVREGYGLQLVVWGCPAAPPGDPHRRTGTPAPHHANR